MSGGRRFGGIRKVGKTVREQRLPQSRTSALNYRNGGAVDNRNQCRRRMQNQTATATIERCGNCHSRISLRRPTPHLPASPWECRRCGAVFLACAQERDGSAFKAGIRPAYYFDVVPTDATHFPFEAAELAEKDVATLRACLPPKVVPRSESRKHPRHAIHAAVRLFSLASDMRIAGAPLGAVAVNVSAGGLAVVSPRPIDEPFFAVEFDAADSTLTPVVLIRLRTRPTENGLEIAGRFLSRIDF